MRKLIKEKDSTNKNVKTDFDESIYDLASENELLKEKKANIAFLKL